MLIHMTLHIRRRHLEGNGPDLFNERTKKWKLAPGGCPDRHRKNAGKYECEMQCPLHISGLLNGKPIRKALKETDLAKAKKLMKQMEDNPDHVLIERNVAKLIAAYLKDKKDNKASSGTLAMYRRALDQFAEYCTTRSICITDVTAKVVEHFLDSRTIEWGRRKGQPVATGTTVINFSNIQTFLRWCADAKIIAVSPLKGKDRPANEKHKPKAHDPIEIDKLLDGCLAMPVRKNADREKVRKQTYAITLLMSLCGLRIGDAFLFSRSKIDFQRNATFIVQGKTDDGVWSDVPQHLMDALDACPKVHEDYYFWSGTGGQESIDAGMDSYYYWVRRAAKFGGIGRTNPHRMRRSFAQCLDDNHTPIRQIQFALGHKNLKTTEIYLGISNAAREELHSNLSRLPFGKKRAGTLLQMAS